VRVVDPLGPALGERDLGESLAVARDQVEAALDRLDEVVVGGRVALEYEHRRDVHVRGPVLQMKERGVQRA
jgi:hypothetical protein